MQLLESPLPDTSSLGRRLDTDPAKFGWLATSNDIVDDPAALRERFERDGYLYLKNFFDRSLIAEARRAITLNLAKAGQLHPDRDPMDGVIHPELTGASEKTAFRPNIKADSPEVKRVVFGPELAEFYTRFFGERVRHFDFIWMRLMGPGKGTPTHCDWVYMGRGSQKLMTCWIPYGDVPIEVGGLILLEGSHQQADRIQNYLGKDVDAYCENNPTQVEAVARNGGSSHRGWLSSRPETLPEKFSARWLTSPLWEMGDFITFNMTLIHGSLDNHSDRVRISTDTRWQPASEPADERWIGANPPGHGLSGKRGRIC